MENLGDGYRVRPDADLVVNATSIGLHPDVDADVPVVLADVAGRALVADVIPNLPETQLLRRAAAAGCETLDGLEMLVEQGRIGFKLWTGIDTDAAVMHQALRQAFLPRLGCPGWSAAAGCRRGTGAHAAYHDEEWGVPERDDRALYELLTLEGAQAGLSWSTILRKREGHRRAFEGSTPRYRALRRAPRRGAARRSRDRPQPPQGGIDGRERQAVSETKEELGSFSSLLWAFVDGCQPLVGGWKALAELPAETPVSKAMSKELKRRGFRFVGPTVCYAFMQAAGLVNDHVVSCFRYREPAVAD